MGAKFKITETRIGSRFGGVEKKGYTATLVTNREISAKEFSEILAEKTRLHPVDCLKVLMTIS